MPWRIISLVSVVARSSSKERSGFSLRRIRDVCVPSVFNIPANSWEILEFVYFIKMLTNCNITYYSSRVSNIYYAIF